MDRDYTKTRLEDEEFKDEEFKDEEFNAEGAKMQRKRREKFKLRKEEKRFICPIYFFPYPC